MHNSALCISFLFASLLLASCAMKVAPSGGEADKTPAAVTATIPADRTINVSDPTIVFEFDDYVDRSIRNSISIQPVTRFTSSYGGDELSITLEDTLRANTTYAITLGTDWRDLRGNTPLSATTIIFSTGPILDSGSIGGTVSTQSATDLVVFAYGDAQTLDTSFTPTKNIPLYRMPVGSSGAFRIGGLHDGTYRLMAVRDKNKNSLIDGGEEYAMDISDIQVVNAQSRTVSMRIDPVVDTTKTVAVDTTKPKMEAGSVSGSFVDSSGAKPPYLMRFVDKQGRIAAAKHVVQGEAWAIDSIPPGTYTIELVSDANDNGRYDAGTANPFQFGESWRSTGVTVTIRERWSTEDVKVIVKP